MTILDFSKFTFNAEQIRDINELIFDDLLKAPEITLVCTLYPGIVFDKEIGFLTGGGLVGKAGQACDPTPQQWRIGTRKVTWQPKTWGIFIQDCWKELESTAAVYSLHTGVRVSDFTDTDYMTIVVEVLSEAIKKFIIRLVWFSDTDADNIANGGIITDGVDVDYFNILDGLWKQLLTQITANPAQRINVTENAGATYADQELIPTDAAKYLQQLKFKAPIVLRSQSNSFIACTQSFHDAYEMFLSGKELESCLVTLLDGRKTLSVSGIPVIPLPIWDEMIAAYENNGTRLNNPHRALFVVKENLAVGVDSEKSFSELDIFYNRESEKVNLKVKGKTDAKVLNPAMFQLAI